MGSFLPITSQLLPFRWRNLVYLAEVAALTRMATGVARVMENRPSKQNDPRLTKNEKRQALTERFFVEILGTMGYMGFLHIGQDIVDKVYSRTGPKIPTFAQLEKTDIGKYNALKTALSQFKLSVEDFDNRIKELYQDKEGRTAGLLHRVLYEHERPLKDNASNLLKDESGKTVVVSEKATLARLQDIIVKQAKHSAAPLAPEEMPKAFQALMKAHCKELTEFASQNNKWAAGAILFGVSLSAFVGGTLTQWMNDRLVAPHAKHWLNKKFVNDSVKPAITQKINQGIATFNNLRFQQPGLQSVRPLANPVAARPAQAIAGNPFNHFPPVTNTPSAAIAPVYLPNPKMQPPATAFGARTLPRPYSTQLSSYTSTRLGGGL